LSSADDGTVRRWAARVGGGCAGFVLASLCAACGTGSADDAAGGAEPTATVGMAADAGTRRLAEVEFHRQCDVDEVSFAAEADITADLDERLADAGFTHQQWKRWHDALAGSPDLVAQFTEVVAEGCAAG
jgi:hypothetical protein